MAENIAPPSEVILERVVIGRYVKVSAIDPATGVEVSILGDPRADPYALGRLATHKLRRKLSELSSSQ